MIESSASEFLLGMVRVFSVGSVALALATAILYLGISPRVKLWAIRLAYLKAMILLATSMAFPLPTLRAIDSALGCQEFTASVSGSFNFLPLAHAVFFLWIVGLIIITLRVYNQFKTFQRIVNSVEPCNVDELKMTLSKIATDMNIRVPFLQLSRQISSPMVFGLKRKTIVLPISSLQMSQASIKMILAHELAHIKSKDLTWNYFNLLCETILHFHPLVWLLKRHRLRFQEFQADEIALAHASETPHVLAEAILHFTEALSKTNSQTIQYSALSMATHFSDLKGRLSNLCHIRARSKRVKTAESVLILSAFLFFVIPWQTPESKANSNIAPPSNQRMSQPKKQKSFIENLITASQKKKC